MPICPFAHVSYYVDGNHAYNKPEENCVPYAFGGHDYFFCPNEKNWHSAQFHCENVGMNLVRINGESGDGGISEGENEFIVNRMISDILNWSRAWIGASDDYTAEGDWRWRDNDQFWEGDENGEPVGGLYSNWDSGEPNDSGDEEDCGEIKSSGVWNDKECSADLPYICEVNVDRSWLLYFTYASILRGLPVAAVDNGQSGGHHALLIDVQRGRSCIIAFYSCIPSGVLPYLLQVSSTST